MRGRRAPRSPQALLRSLEGSDHRGRKCVGRGIATRSGVAAPPALKDVILGALDDEGGQQYLAEQDLPHSAPGAELKRTLQGPNRLVRNCLGLETRVGSVIWQIVDARILLTATVPPALPVSRPSDGSLAPPFDTPTRFLD